MERGETRLLKLARLVGERGGDWDARCCGTLSEARDLVSYFVQRELEFVTLATELFVFAGHGHIVLATRHGGGKVRQVLCCAS